MNTGKYGSQNPMILNPAPVLSALAGRAGQMLLVIGQEGIELLVTLAVMIMVERACGPRGLGIFAYLTGCMYAARYLANFGVARHVEVAIARTSNEAHRNSLILNGFQWTLLAATATAVLLFASAAFDTAHTRIQEQMGAYVILALSLPVANLNALKFSVMHGTGRHHQVARVRIQRHGLLFGAMFLLTRTAIPPSYLLAAYPAADAVTAVLLRRHIRLPKLFTAFKSLENVRQTFKKGEAHLFTDSPLNLLLNIDMLVLGLFVNAWDLGVYAQAAILVRCCLVIAVGIRPIFRRRYTLMASQQPALLKPLLRRHTAWLFSLQAILAIFTLIYYPTVLDLFFVIRGETAQSFNIFLVFVPGLIYYGTYSAMEPIYEATGRVDGLKRLTVSVAVINLFLTLFLVPSAGIYGAACATMMSMLIHFFMFGRGLPLAVSPSKMTLLTSGLALYLIYTLVRGLSWQPPITIWLAPALLVGAFYGCGLFGAQSEHTKPKGDLEK